MCSQLTNLIAIVAALMSVPAIAQQVTFVEFNCEGVITRIAPSAVELRTTDGAMRVLQLNSQGARRRFAPPVVEVSAPLPAAQIKPGMVAKFHAVPAADGTIDQPLQTLQVADVKLKKKQAPAVPSDPSAPLNSMLFVGEVKEFDAEKVTISMKPGEIAAPINAATKLVLQGADPKQVKPGDQIYARGIMQAVSMQPPIYFAQFVSVEMAEAPEFPGGGDLPDEADPPEQKKKRPTYRIEIRKIR